MGESGQVFVGRRGELGVLRMMVTALADGRGGVAWVEGEPGIGKSALLAQVLSTAKDLGCSVFAGAADQLRGLFPLGVMLDCLGLDGRAADGPAAEIVALLRGDGLRAFMAVGDGVAAAAERLLGYVDQLCVTRPVVLAIDDLQWADEASVSVWYRLTAGVGQVPLLVLGFGRPAPRTPGLQVARRAAADRGGLVMSLRPLAADEVATLVGSLVGGSPGPVLLAQADRAGGNPLYVRELTDALLREDRVRLSGGVAEMTGEADAAPVSLAAAIEDRLGFVSAPALDMLRMAALLGSRFSVRDLALVGGREARDLAGPLGEAIAAGVLVESGLDLTFRHGLIQQALAGAMPAGLRAELHRDAARQLASAGAAAERVAAQLLAVAGEVEHWAVDWLAGHGAELTHRAPRSAAELLARVASTAAGPERTEMLDEHLAATLFMLGRYDQAEQTARRLIARTSDPERRAKTAWTLCYALLRENKPDEALAVIDAVPPDAGAAWVARLASMRAMVLLNASRFAEAELAAAAALDAAERADDWFAGGYALHVRSMIRLVAGDDAGALDIVTRALAVIGDAPATADLRLILLTNEFVTLADLDRDAIAECRELLTLAERTGTTRGGAIRTSAAMYLFDVGRWDDALAELEAVFDPGTDIEAALLTYCHGIAALIASHRDERDRVGPHLRAAAASLPALAGHNRIYGGTANAAHATFAEREGRLAEAVAFWSATSAGREDNGELVPWLPDLVRCALAVGDRQAALAATVSSEQQAALHERLRLAGAIAQRCRGLVDGDPAVLGVAVGYYRSVSRPLDLGQSLEDLAVVHAACGNPAAARSALAEAAKVYVSLGADWDLVRADARLRRYGIRRGRPGARRPATGWAALTPTELKVAHLVAAGLSNPEIGAKLFLSRYTVQVHVSRILSKLGARSRVAVASEVARRGRGSDNPGE